MSQAQEYQDRAARVGFDWPEIEGVLDKIAEEIDEIKRATNEEELAAEIGDLLFALVNLARWKKVDAEFALRGTNMKFKKRFAYVEQGAKKQGRELSSLSLDEMEVLVAGSEKAGWLIVRIRVFGYRPGSCLSYGRFIFWRASAIDQINPNQNDDAADNLLDT